MAIGFALDVEDGVVTRARIGLGGVAATPVRALATEAALEGRPWTLETAQAAADVLRGEGTPIDDHRASAAYRAAMLGQGLRKLYAEKPGGGVGMSALSERPESPSVGVAIPHESAALHVTGKALYTDDLVERTKDVLHAYPVQVGLAHGRVTALRTDPALAVPGVVRVLTAADVPGVNDAGVKTSRCFPVRSCSTATPCAGCWARRSRPPGSARRLSRSRSSRSSYIKVTEAIEAESFQGAMPQVRRGDIEAGFAAAAHVFSGDLEFSGQEHFYLETHCALAYVDEGEQVFVQSSTQHPSETQEIVAHVLGRHNHEITVQCLRMGGGFGGKEMQPHGFAAIAALGATLTGRPVRLRLNRTQDLTMSGKRHGFHADWRVGFDEDGRIVALDATLTADGGWSLDLSEPVLARALCHIDNAYWLPNIRVNGRIAKTHKTSNTAFRGFGGPRACW